ncbi:MAG: sensor signal transduction histidine kinase [Nitrospirae bacterium]|nr:sensor signal transduction histidine kinase [Nitrospirota bacterium]
MIHSVILITILSLLVFLFLFVLVRTVLDFQKKKIEAKNREVTQVGFVVDTFHDLVSKLKDKERELEKLRKDAEERAWSVEMYNEDILQSVPSGVVSFDQESRIMKMNAAAEHILEMKQSDIRMKAYHEVFHKPITDLIDRRETVERAEVSYLTGSGKRIWLGLTISPLRDSTDRNIGQLLVFTDLTELKAFQFQKDLRERLSTLGEMSAGIAHEMRNPLAVISGYTKMLSKKVDDSMKPAVDSIAKEVTVMDRIIADFLSFAKPTDLIVSEVDLKVLLEECLSSLEETSGGMTFSLNAEMLPHIRADEVLLRQACTNLLQNAIESMPDGGALQINGFLDDSVSISITDTGHGIPESIRSKIFLPFYTTKERGTGLGLAIVHKIIVSHGGDMKVDTGDKGTTFTIRLPKTLMVS